MNNQRVFLTATAILASLVVGWLVGSRSPQITSNPATNTNPFLSVESDTEKASDDLNSALSIESDRNILTVGKESFTYRDLPPDVQQDIYRLNQRNHDQLMGILKGFAVRLNTVREAPKGDNVPVENLPNLATLVKDLVSDQEVNKYYNRNKKLYKKGHNVFAKKNQIRFELMSSKAYSYVYSSLQNLYNREKLNFDLKAPAIPESWLEFPNTPKLGNKDAPVKIKMIANHFCTECRKYTKQIAEVYKKAPKNSVELNLIPYTTSAGALDGVFIKAGLCINDQNPKVYWDFHVKLFTEWKKYFIPDLALPSKKDLAFIKGFVKKFPIDHKKWNTCFADKDKSMTKRINTVARGIAFLALKINALPVFYVNGHRIDTEARTLYQALKAEQLLQ